MKFIFIFLILILSISCTSDKTEDSNAGKLNEACKSDNLCDVNLACIDDKCIAKDDACKFITCSGEDGYSHGTCSIESSKAVCICNNSYERVNDTRCELSSTQSICKADTCNTADGYICLIEDNLAKCICPDKYKETEGHDMCILNQDAFCNPNPCDKEHMSGYCNALMDDDGKVEEICECNRGWLGENCDEAEQGCDKTLCLNDENSTGECYMDISDPNKETICICKDDFVLTNTSGDIWKCLVEKGE